MRLSKKETSSKFPVRIGPRADIFRCLCRQSEPDRGNRIDKQTNKHSLSHSLNQSNNRQTGNRHPAIRLPVKSRTNIHPQKTNNHLPPARLTAGCPDPKLQNSLHETIIAPAWENPHMLTPNNPANDIRIVLLETDKNCLIGNNPYLQAGKKEIYIRAKDSPILRFPKEDDNPILVLIR